MTGRPTNRTVRYRTDSHPPAWYHSLSSRPGPGTLPVSRAATSDPRYGVPKRPPPSPVSTTTPLPDRRFLCCQDRGRADEVTQPALMQHVRDGWPKCCGEAMAYVREVALASARYPTCGRSAALTFPAATPLSAPVRIVCLRCALPPGGEAQS